MKPGGRPGVGLAVAFWGALCCQHTWNSVPVGSVVQARSLGPDDRVGIRALQGVTSSGVGVQVLWADGLPGSQWEPSLGISSGMGPQVPLAFIVIEV